MALQIRRGPTADRTGVKFLQGELILDTDTNEVFVGDSTNGVDGTSGGRPVTAYTDEKAKDAAGALLTTSTGNVAFTYNSGTNALTANVTLDGVGISNVVEDTTPQLGGDLDLNTNDITGTGNINITGTVTATSFSGPLTGNVTGDVKATNGTVVLDNGTDGTDATFTGEVTGNISGNVTGDVKATDGTVVLDNGTDGTDATFTGEVTGNVIGDVTGNVTGDVKASGGAIVLASGTDGTDATFAGEVTGSLIGNVKNLSYSIPVVDVDSYALRINSINAQNESIIDVNHDINLHGRATFYYSARALGGWFSPSGYSLGNEPTPGNVVYYMNIATRAATFNIPVQFGKYTTAERNALGYGATILTASWNSGSATLTFDDQLIPLFEVGATIDVSGVGEAGYNGSFTVTDCTNTSVSYGVVSTLPSSTGGIVAGPVHNGTIIYNTSTHTFDGYANGAWVVIGTQS